MPTARYVTINGTQFNPSNISRDVEKRGTVLEMASGKTRYFHRAHKSKWTLTWNNVREDYVTTIRALYLLTTSFTYTDEESTSYTVLCTPGGFRTELDAGSVSLTGTKYYTVELTLTEV